jgi:anti-sigma factor RsiW
MNQDLELKLQALLDGELPPAEVREIRRLAATDPAAGSLLAELQAVKAVLRHNEQTVTVPETRDFYWSKIARQIEHQERTTAARPFPWPARLRHILAALTGVAALAVALIVATRPPASQVAFNQVSVTADGYEARTFRDQPSGLTFVFLHDTTNPPDAQPQSARVREDGSSFLVEPE